MIAEDRKSWVGFAGWLSVPLLQHPALYGFRLAFLRQAVRTDLFAREWEIFQAHCAVLGYSAGLDGMFGVSNKRRKTAGPSIGHFQISDCITTYILIVYMIFQHNRESSKCKKNDNSISSSNRIFFRL